jgi:hypothetical protein
VAELTREFFLRDLSEEEEELLKSSLQDLATAQLFADEAQAAYLATGLGLRTLRIERLLRKLALLKPVVVVVTSAAMAAASWMATHRPCPLPPATQLPQLAVPTAVVPHLQPLPACDTPSAFFKRVQIKLPLGAKGPVSVKILDANGRWVCTLNEGPLQPGQADLWWDGQDAKGLAVRPGVYEVVVTSEGKTEARTLLVDNRKPKAAVADERKP